MNKNKRSTALLAAMFAVAGIAVASTVPADDSGVLASGTSNLVLDSFVHSGGAKSTEVESGTNLTSDYDNDISSPVFRAVQLSASPMTAAVSVPVPVASPVEEVGFAAVAAPAPAPAPVQEIAAVKPVTGVAVAQSLSTLSAPASTMGHSEASKTNAPAPSVAVNAYPGVSGSERTVLIQPVKSTGREVLSRLGQTGAVPRKVQAVTGSGHRQNFVSALQSVVPSGWSAFSSDNGVKNAPVVTWHESNRPWTEVLNRLLVQGGMRAMVDWDRKEVDIRLYSQDLDQAVISPSVAASATLSAGRPAVATQEKQASAPTVVPSEKMSRFPDRSRLEQKQSASIRGSISDDDIDLAIAKAAEIEIARSLTKDTRLKKQAFLDSAGNYRATRSSASSVERSVTGVAAALEKPAGDVKAVSPSVAVADSMDAEVEKAEIAAARATVSDIQAARDKQSLGYATAAAPIAVKQVAQRKNRSVKIEGVPQAGPYVKVSGYNIPLFTALSQIAPAGWFVYSKDPKISNKLLVGWRGGNRPWVDVLDDLLTANHLAAVVSQGSNEIQIVASE